MKKPLLTVFSMSLLVLCLLLLSACSSEVSEPAGLRLNMDTQTLTWHRVSTANGYTVVINGEEKTIRSNYISLEFLEPGTYEIKIKALGNDDDLEDSDWVSYTYTREAESGLNYKLINNNTEYQVTGAGSASGDVVMESVYRGKPVTSIADKAFSSNSQITSMVIGEHVKTIGKNAFARCTALKSITIPDSVTSIGEYAFQSCKQLESIQLPSGVTVVPAYMFSWCSALKNVTFGAQTTFVSEYAFSNCESLQKVILPDTTKVIDQYAFSDCSALTELSLGAGVEEIDEYAFYNCISLEGVDFGQNLLQIGKYAFGNCAKITQITIPDSCTTIGDQAFRYCYALENITLGQGITSLGGKAFSDTKFYDEAEGLVIIGDWVVGTKDKELEVLELPENISGIGDGAFMSCEQLIDGTYFRGVKYVGKYAFAYCTSVWDVDFDDALLVIDDYAFTGCSELKDLELGTSLKSIGKYAFYDCSKFTGEKFDMPDSLVSVGKSAFKNTYAHKASPSAVYIDDWLVGVNVDSGIGFGDLPIKEGTRGIANYAVSGVPILIAVVIPDSVEYIGKGALYECSLVQRITLPKNLKEIGDYAFYGCGNAWFTTPEDLDGDGTTRIPEGTISIGRSAFYNCRSMVGLHIPSTVKSIGDYAFYNCVNLGESAVYIGEDPEDCLVGEVILEEGIETIGSRAFAGCERLVNIVIPNSVQSIGIRAFYKCTKLTDVTLGSGITEIPEYMFYNCEQLEKVSMTDNVRTVGKYAFRGCSALKELKLSAGLEKIGNFAFYSCAGLRQIVLPQTVTQIGDYAFRGCSAVTSVVIPATVAEIGKHAFYGMKNATIYCESASIPAYWSEHWNTTYRPVVWGVTLSEDKTYVVSFVKGTDNPDNISELVTVSLPKREGYVCEGFTVMVADNDPQIYGPKQIADLPDGTVVHILWRAQPET